MCYYVSKIPEGCKLGKNCKQCPNLSVGLFSKPYTDKPRHVKRLFRYANTDNHNDIAFVYFIGQLQSPKIAYTEIL